MTDALLQLTKDLREEYRQRLQACNNLAAQHQGTEVGKKYQIKTDTIRDFIYDLDEALKKGGQN